MNNVVDLSQQVNSRVERFLPRVRDAGIGDHVATELSEWVGFLSVIRNYADRTVELYRNAVIEYFVWLQSTRYQAITVESVESWLRHLTLKQRNSASTCTLKLSAIRQFCAWREYHGKGINPLRGVPGPKRQRHIAQKFSTEQLQRLFATFDRGTAIGLRNYALLGLMYATGARRNEMIELNLEQLELQKRVGAVRFFGKGAKERVLSFEGPLVDALYEWLSVRDSYVTDPGREAVWIALGPPNKGGRLCAATLANIFHRAARQAGLRAGSAWPHKMRSTFATDMYDAGVDLEIIRVLMGHSDIRTTEAYLAITDKRLRARMPAARLHELLNDNVTRMPAYALSKVKGRHGEDILS